LKKIGVLLEPANSRPLESRIDPVVASGLRDLGHDVKEWPDWEWTAEAVCTVLADWKEERLEGGADPRRPAATLAW
jgi:gamma-glutamyltranspeptidase